MGTEQETGNLCWALTAPASAESHILEENANKQMRKELR